ncbi:MAG: alpha amylase N-terminal ig-like domain-containing protein [Bacilli bacterium]|nr:alpha amylase N-terminal ig-like domain-containing protein [Bacilli bacterium]
MNATYFRHLSDSRYCFALDSSHTLLRVNVSKSCPIEEMYIIYGDPMDFTRFHHEQKMEVRYEDKSFYFDETTLCLYPIRLMYIFRFVKDGK